MNVTILGATGFVGKALTSKAIETHNVKVLVRSPDKLGELKNKLTCIEGDYFDEGSLRMALTGSEAVLSCIGPPLGFGRSEYIGKYPAAMRSLINAMQASEIKRVVMIAGSSVPVSGTELPLLAKISRVVMNIVGGQISRDKDEEAHILSQSELDWTILRPPGIKANKRGTFYVSESSLKSPFVDLDQLCQFMLENLTDDTWVKKAPFTGTR